MIPVYWIYQRINSVFRLISLNVIALNNCKSVDFELQRDINGYISMSAIACPTVVLLR